MERESALLLLQSLLSLQLLSELIRASWRASVSDAAALAPRTGVCCLQNFARFPGGVVGGGERSWRKPDLSKSSVFSSLAWMLGLSRSAVIGWTVAYCL